jgi:hypothetical protein
MTPLIQPRVSGGELLDAVHTVLTPHFRALRRIKSLRRRRSAYSSSSTLENLDVQLDTGKRLRLVFKDLSPRSQLITARQVRPLFLYQPRREIEIYRRILDSRKLDTPLFYGAIEDPEQERYWLFLERVDGPLLWQRGRLDLWEQAARWLARFHSEFAAASSDEPSLDHVLSYDERLFSVWLTRAENFLSQKYAARSPHLWRRFYNVTNRYDEVIKRLLELPTTFIHGEFFPSNIILRETSRGWRICPVDWEIAALGPGLIDLAALTAGNWTREQKTKLVRAYSDALEPCNGWPPAMPELMEAVDYCHLHLSMQLLGWSSDWSPPERHYQNWLGEAFRLAGSLGL